MAQGRSQSLFGPIFMDFGSHFGIYFPMFLGIDFAIDFSLTFYRFSVPLNLAKSDFYVGRVANFMVLQASNFIRF